MVDKPQFAQVALGISGSDPLPEPVGANFFHFAVVGSEIQLLVGAINLVQLHEARQGHSGPIRPQISHRFLLSPLGFAQLKSQITEMAAVVPAAPGISVGTKMEGSK